MRKLYNVLFWGSAPLLAAGAAFGVWSLWVLPIFALAYCLGVARRDIERYEEESSSIAPDA